MILEYAHDTLLWEKQYKNVYAINLNFHLKYMHIPTHVEERTEESMLQIFVTGW